MKKLAWNLNFTAHCCICRKRTWHKVLNSHGEGPEDQTIYCAEHEGDNGMFYRFNLWGWRFNFLDADFGAWRIERKMTPEEIAFHCK